MKKPVRPFGYSATMLLRLYSQDALTPDSLAYVEENINDLIDEACAENIKPYKVVKGMLEGRTFFGSLNPETGCVRDINSIGLSFPLSVLEEVNYEEFR